MKVSSKLAGLGLAASLLAQPALAADKIKIGVIGELASIVGTHDSNLFATRANESNFGDTNSLINASFSADVRLLNRDEH